MRVIIAVLAAASLVAAQESGLKQLYEAHRWNDLHEALKKQKGTDFDRGADAAVFNDMVRAERLLQSVIRRDPHSSEAFEASEWLAHIYLRTGRYHALLKTMEARWAAFPEKNESHKEIEAFRGLPDQVTGKIKPASLPHDRGEIFIPLTINHKEATYFFDTGAWLNCMSESETKRLGLTIHDSGGSLGTASGAPVGFRTAVAPEVVIGAIHYKNVTFAVFPDNQEPWSLLKEGRRGLIGMPLIQAFRVFRWEKDGTFQIGLPATPLDGRLANIYFDSDNLTVASEFNGQRIIATVDTGAIDTDLYEGFAKRFPKFIEEKGKKDKTEIRGVGHAENFESINLPDLKLSLGGATVVLSPAHVVLKQIGNPRAVGNFGMDLFKQGRAFKIDFTAMRLDLEP